ncbi:hypothetical protein LSTR_LSTR011224 [Laodelphax striatellus]|uniref:Elongin-C n=1 Tax=Laodelphax striatellus TaxID=195883 RepID=A0A482XM05_LAOST|nr:hypothetical protein LSTR_LSTR011224 [Laodelphax striatellus]
MYGGCEGQRALYIKLISSDGHEFIIRRKYAIVSIKIKQMLSGPKQIEEDKTNALEFTEYKIPSHLMQKLCIYFTYRVFYTNYSSEVPDFPLTIQEAVELYKVAKYLYC